MHSGVVERIAPVDDAQEARALFESLCAEPRHFEQVAAGAEGAVRSAIFHDFFGQRRAESTHIGEQVGRSGVEIHAHGIHTTLDSLIQRAFECTGIDVVLILSHADGLGIDFHQFGQGVGESATDGNGSANGDIVVGKFLTRRGRCRIDRGPVLAHEEDFHALDVQGAHQFFGFASRGAVADGHGLDGVVFEQAAQSLFGAHGFVFRRVGINGFVVEQGALRIKTHHFAPCAETGVDAHDATLPEGRCEEQLLEIGGENANGLFVGLLLARGRELGFDARAEQSLVSVGGCQFDLFGGPRSGLHIAARHLLGGAIIVGRGDGDAQHALAFASAHGQQAVGSAALEGFAPIEVVAIFGGLGGVGFSLHGFRSDHRLARINVA